MTNTDPNAWIMAFDGDNQFPPAVAKPKHNQKLQWKDNWNERDMMYVVAIHAGLRLAMEDEVRRSNHPAIETLRALFDDNERYFVREILQHIAPAIVEARKAMDKRIVRYVRIETFATEMAFFVDWRTYWDTGQFDLSKYVDKVNTVLVAQLTIQGIIQPE